MNDKHPIKFYSAEDLATSYNINKVQAYIAHFDFTRRDFTITDILEIHNVLKYLKLPVVDKNEAVIKFQRATQKLVSCYFAEREIEDLDGEYKTLYNPYKEDFWESFVDYKLIKKTSSIQFQRFIATNEVYIGSLLGQKAICDKYKVILKATLLKKPRYFELFLRKYDSATGEKYELPTGFTSSEVSDWARRYCELPDANINYLKQLAQWSPKHEHKIDDKVLLKAKRAVQQTFSTVFEEDKGFSWGIGVSIKSNVTEGIAFKSIGERAFQLDFDQNWLDDERDKPTLLNNFIYLFGFFDRIGRFSFIGSQNMSGSLFEMIQTESKYSYKLSLDFKIKKTLYSLAFLAYYDYLAHNDIDIEELFAFCYNELFADVFKNDQFFFTASPKENNYYTRSKALIPELDSLLKQYDFYQKDGEIDLELFELQSKSNGYRSIKSLADKKFVYLDNEETKNLCRLLFDGQSSLSFPEKKKGLTSFYEYVREGVSLDDFYDMQQHVITQHLLVKGIIDYDAANCLCFKDLTVINLYKIMWESGYCPLFGFSDELLQRISNEVKMGNLRYGDTLFSEQESDYISYIMDNKKFNNALAIRNKITHGSFAKKSAKEHKDYYLELLIILMLYTVRINEELDYQDRKQADA